MLTVRCQQLQLVPWCTQVLGSWAALPGVQLMHLPVVAGADVLPWHWQVDDQELPAPDAHEMLLLLLAAYEVAGDNEAGRKAQLRLVLCGLWVAKQQAWLAESLG